VLELAAKINLLTPADLLASKTFKKPDMFTELVAIGWAIERGTDPNAA
jgi:hypothetical protein